MDLLEVLKKINEIESFNNLEIILAKEIIFDELNKLNNYENSTNKELI